MTDLAGDRRTLRRSGAPGAPEAPATIQAPTDLDADRGADLELAGLALVSEGHRHLVVDCSRVRFCDGDGLRSLTLLSNEVLPDGSVTLSPVLVHRSEATGTSSRTNNSIAVKEQ